MGKTSLGAIQISNHTTNFREAIARKWHISKPQDSAVLLAGNKEIKKILPAERLFLEEEPASEWHLCKGREADKGEPPHQIKLLMWTYLMIFKCAFLLKQFVIQQVVPSLNR